MNLTTWTPAIYDLLETLTCRIRVLSLQQIQRGWLETFGCPRSSLNVIERLVEAGLLQGDVWNLPPIPIGERPLSRWNPGDDRPDLKTIECTIQDRWDLPTSPVPVVAATQKTFRLFGSSGGGLPPANNRNHDLLLSEVYLRLRLASPVIADRWIGEDALPLAERGIKNPDAFLLSESGEIEYVIESAGRYDIEQLTSFHNHCVEEQLAYELW